MSDAPRFPADLLRITSAAADRFRRLIERRAASYAVAEGRDEVSVADVCDAIEDIETCEIDLDDLIDIDIEDEE